MKSDEKCEPAQRRCAKRLDAGRLHSSCESFPRDSLDVKNSMSCSPRSGSQLLALARRMRPATREVLVARMHRARDFRCARRGPKHPIEGRNKPFAAVLRLSPKNLGSIAEPNWNARRQIHATTRSGTRVARDYSIQPGIEASEWFVPSLHGRVGNGQPGKVCSDPPNISRNGRA